MGCLYYLHVGCFCRNRIFICFSGRTFHDTIRQHLLIQSDERLKWQPALNDKTHSPLFSEDIICLQKIPENKHELGVAEDIKNISTSSFFPHSSFSSSINKGADGSALMERRGRKHIKHKLSLS